MWEDLYEKISFDKPLQILHKSQINKKGEINLGGVTKIGIGIAILLLLSLPWILIAGGTYFSPNPSIPAIKHGEFPFHLVYEKNGRQYTIDDTVVCDYAGMDMNEGQGKYLKWEQHLASGHQIRKYSIAKTYHYGITLFEGPIQGQGSTTIICDIGNPQYYLGYYEYADYNPGSVLKILWGSSGSGVISEEELWDNYKIKIIEKQFSQPLVGNHI